ncbi:MAG TPA: hypothetical protein PK736_04980 [Bacteroidia bacterium]|nr:hypothetical protein [Bacteroidia bacterium]
MDHFKLLIILLTLSLSIRGQVRVNLTFEDDTDSSFISDAFVLDITNGRTYQTNSKGMIDLILGEMPSQIKYTIRHLNYVCDTFVFTPSSAVTYTVYVKPKFFQISPVDVSSQSAKEVMQRALQQIESLYNKEKANSHYFYRQYHYENGHEVRWIECDVVLEKYPVINRSQNLNYAKMYVSNLKKTKVTEQNQDEHGDHLADLLNQIPTINSIGTVCNYKAIDSYNFVFDIENETADLYAINFQSKSALGDKLEMGNIIINKSDFAFLKIETQHYPTKQYYNNLIFGHSNKFVWSMKNESTIFTFSKYRNSYSLISCFKTYTHDLIYSDTKQKAFVVTENFELFVSKSGSINTPVSKKSFSQFTNLYTSHGEDLVIPNANYPCVFCK